MRYLPHTDKQRKEMLEQIGVSDINKFFSHIPEGCNYDIKDTSKGLSEFELINEFQKISDKNFTAKSGKFFLGAGCYYHYIPSAVDHLIQRSEFLTSYTPYQPEISQGTLISIFEFQTIIARLTGMDVANASMYDGATATAEAALMAIRVSKKNKILLSGSLHPQYQDVVKTYCSNMEDVDVKSLDVNNIDDQTACIIIQNPDYYGNLHNFDQLVSVCKEKNVMIVVVVNEILSLGLLQPYKFADIVVGEAQSLAIPMSFGGPHLGFFACKEKYMRQIPGRICGQTVDKDGKRSFVLTLNAREQHIRREKATSNICSNQALCALAFTIHMCLLGEQGFKKLAMLNHQRAVYLYKKLKLIKNIKIHNQNFFNEFTISSQLSNMLLLEKFKKHGIIAGKASNDNELIIAVTEQSSTSDLDNFAEILSNIVG